MECKDATTQDKILKLDGTLVENKPIRCVRMDREMTSDEIFSHILRKLEQEEMVNQMLTNAKSTDGVQVHAISNLAPENES